MKMKLFTGLATGLFLVALAGGASATLLTIGSAGYDSNGNGTVETGERYNLIYDQDDSLIWLDYTNGSTTWSNQMSWASGLNTGSTLDITIDSAYDVTWDSNDSWGLAEIGELSKLYSEKSAVDYAGNFDHLSYWYWSSTEEAEVAEVIAWFFSMLSGYQGYDYKGFKHYGLAVFSGQVSEADPVPEPATMLLFGTGLAGLVGLNRRKKGSRV